jgi:hypothetical protein
VGYLAGQITGIPFLLRHGGSDLNKFVDAGILKYLASKALATASAIITDKKNYERFFEFSKHVVAIPPYVPNPAFFKSAVNKKIRPTLALIGKANYYWRHKGWHRAIKIMKNLGDRFHYLVISQGVGLIDFKNYVEDQIDFPIEWRCFVHPFEIPQLFQTISGIFILQKDLPFPVFSNLVMEALFCNVTVITDTYDMAQTLKEYDLHINADSRHVLVIPVDQPDKAAKIIINYFEHGVPEPLHIGQREYDHAAYIQKNEDTILSVIKSC